MMRSSQLVLAAFSALVTLPGCGGSGGGLSPTDPGPPAMVQGIWVGTATSLSATGTCLAERFQGLTVPARWVIQQAGETFTGNQTLNNLVTCQFRGTVSGATVTFFPSTAGASFCTVQTGTCGTGSSRYSVRMELRTDRVIQTAIVNGNTMTATGTSVWRILDAGTGASLGDYEVRGTQTLQRQ